MANFAPGIFSLALILCLSLSASGTDIKTLSAEDIEFWDIDSTKDIPESEKTTIKENIVNQLSVTIKEDDESGKACVCPKIFGPVICDNLGRAHTNICLFLCQKRALPDLVPKKVLITLESGNHAERCKIA